LFRACCRLRLRFTAPPPAPLTDEVALFTARVFCGSSLLAMERR
jgi:hypothetical protein